MKAATELTVRPAVDTDYPAIAELCRRIRPDDLYSAAEILHSDRSYAPTYLFGRLVAVRNETLLGTATYRHMPGSFHPQRFLIDVQVAPEHRRRGVGSALHAALREALAPHQPAGLRCRARVSDGWLLARLEQLGFTETKRDWRAVVDVASLDLTPFEPLERKLAGEGITAHSLAELGLTATAEQTARAFHELFSDVRNDVPRAEPATPLGFEAFTRFVLDAPDFLPEGVFVAVDAGAGTPAGTWVGMTQLWHSEVGPDLYTGLTGVRRSHRRRGVATLLKVASLRYAQRVGAPTVDTENDTRNREMIRINDRLGYRRGEAWASLAWNAPQGEA